MYSVVVTASTWFKVRLAIDDALGAKYNDSAFPDAPPKVRLVVKLPPSLPPVLVIPPLDVKSVPILKVPLVRVSVPLTVVILNGSMVAFPDASLIIRLL